jgi:hypothetical protein
MKLPKLDLSLLPDLDTLTGLFGTLAQQVSPGHDDSIVILATYVYDVATPTGPASFF